MGLVSAGTVANRKVFFSLEPGRKRGPREMDLGWYNKAFLSPGTWMGQPC